VTKSTQKNSNSKPNQKRYVSISTFIHISIQP